MNTSILKSIAGGVIIGAALFFMPFFLLRLAVIILIIGALIRLFVRPSFRGTPPYNRQFSAFIDRIRNMTDEEYQKFQQKNQHGCGRFQEPA